MTFDSQNEEPCLVETRQGFSVSYKGRHLYSKYNPSRTIVQSIENLELLSGTLILCASPCLWYGLTELLQKLPANCFVAGIEADKKLFDLASETLSAMQKKAREDSSPLAPSLEKVSLFSFSQMQKIHTLFSNTEKPDSPLPAVHTFKRAILLDFSAGTAFYTEQYKNTVYNAEAVIARFWKNRVTLVKLGRLFSRNIFKNLKSLPESSLLSDYEKSVSKPILVCGAGESLEVTVRQIKSYLKESGLRDNKTLPWYILCVDAAAPILKEYGIEADGVVAVESQLAIEKAYIANKDMKCTIFADLTSRPSVTRHTQKDVCFFTSEYTEATFLKRLEKQGLLPTKIEPMGSVGLVAVHIALTLRKNETVPVFVTGLDFSYSLGLTHARCAPAHKERLISAKRTKSPANYDAAFKTGATFVNGKNGPVISDTALLSYASQFQQLFCFKKNLFDAGESGISLNIPVSGTKLFDSAQEYLKTPETPAEPEREQKSNITEKAVKDFILGEKSALLRIKEILINGEKVQKPGKSIQEELSELLKEREYLYLHFPDGYECKSPDISFLKRVRSEIDFFLKDFEK